MGFDTETVDGLPFTCQFSTSGGERDVFECYGRSDLIRDHFSRLLVDAPDRAFILVGAHYLRFDIQVLFRDFPQMFAGLGEIDYTDAAGVSWRGSTNWPVIFAIARYQGKTLLLIDTFRFFFGGLAGVCEALKIKVQKLQRPACIAENRAPTPKEMPYFLKYAMTDSDAVLEILQWIDHIWELQGVGPCVSIAHQAGRIFRRNHTKIDNKIVGLDAADHFGQLGGIHAYHGGRNSVNAQAAARVEIERFQHPDGVTVTEKQPLFPMRVENCTLFDVRSMYPWICSDLLPSFFGGRWVWSDTPEIEPAGLYRVSGRVRKGDCWPYRLLMNDEGNYIPPDALTVGEWVTGFELESALKHGLIETTNITGYLWKPGEETRHPFREYFSWVFEEKEKHRDTSPALYLYYKYLANALTGKFVSTIPQLKVNPVSGQLGKIRVPGMLFNAPIGALITGAGRAYLFEQELLSSSIHGATDSIVVPPWGRKPGNIGGNLGQWEEVCSGTFVCGRNKLYAFISPKKRGNFTGKKLVSGKTKYFYKGQEILKHATHAFNGGIFEFLKMCETGQRQYKYRRMAQLREAQRRPGLRALTFNDFEAELKLGGKYGG